jgi:hypothetical protein
MNKKIWIGAGTVFVIIAALDFLLNGVLLMPEFDATPNLWRPMAEMKMWIFFVTYAFIAYFFTLVFSKGFEGKGVMEGVRYGTYIAMMVSLPAAYGMYGSMPIPYSLALKWFLGGWVQFILCGIALTYVFKTKSAEPAA